MSVFFDTTRNAGGNVTFSNGNQTAHNTGGSNQPAYGTIGYSAGKYVFSVILNQNGGGGTVASAMGFGLGDASASSAAHNLGFDSASNTLGLYFDGATAAYKNVTFTPPAVTATVGDQADFAIDFTGELFWYRTTTTSNWNDSGTANPATGAGGISFATAGLPSGTAFYPAVDCNAGSQGEEYTFTTPPVISGFSAWAPSGTLNEAFADFTLSGAASALAQGSLSETFADFTLSGTAQALARGNLNETFANFVLTGTGLGQPTSNGSLHETFGEFALSGAGQALAQGVLNTTFGAFTLAGSGQVTQLYTVNNNFLPGLLSGGGDIAAVLSPIPGLTPGVIVNIFDWAVNPATGDLLVDDGLFTSVILSLWSDRLANADDPLPTNSGDRSGWWGDPYLPARADGSPDHIGSRLWLLTRALASPQTALAAQSYVEEALAWTTEDGIAQSVTVPIPIYPAPGFMSIDIAITQQTAGTPIARRFRALWNMTQGSLAGLVVQDGGGAGTPIAIGGGTLITDSTGAILLTTAGGELLTWP